MVRVDDTKPQVTSIQERGIAETNILHTNPVERPVAAESPADVVVKIQVRELTQCYARRRAITRVPRTRITRSESCTRGIGCVATSAMYSDYLLKSRKVRTRTSSRCPIPNRLPSQ